MELRSNGERVRAGQLLLARPDMVDPNFARTVVYLIEHDENGSLGVVLNRPMGVAVSAHLEALEPAVSYPVVFFEGGPVAPGTVVGLGGSGYSPPGLVDLDAVVSGDVQLEFLRLYAGYAGWAAGQLQEELASGSWIVAAAQRRSLGADDLFSPRPEELWRRVLSRQPSPIARMALYPEDLIAN
ncbi:MAG: YqgE/AlgH family protein [Microthrixaceae bacterium]